MSGADLAALVGRLRSLDTCAVSDALDRLGLTPGITGLLQLATEQRIAGRVRTVTLSAGTAPPPKPGEPVRHLCTAAIDSSGPLEVIVVEQRTGLDAAAWGGILSAAARLRGIAGVIVEGPARDIDEARGLGFPVYARTATARTARGRIYESATDAPIRVGEAHVESGDLVLADASAVVFIPIARAEEVITAATDIAAREAQMLALLRRGDPVSQVMGGNYENMLKG